MLGSRRRARGTDRRKLSRKKDRLSRDYILTDRLPDKQDRPAKIERTGGVVLDPLAEVSIRVLMPVGVDRREIMVDSQCGGKWGQRQ